MKITFKDGKETTGIFKISKPFFANSSSTIMLISKETKEKYTLDEFSNVIVYGDKQFLYYEVIDVKINFSDKKTEKKLGLVAFAGNKMNVYYISETIHSGGTVGIHSVSGSFETYVKKLDDKVAYNMGYIYGAGARGIKKRVKDYFTDCPKLIENVENEVIKKEETIEMAKFYESNCGI